MSVANINAFGTRMINTEILIDHKGCVDFSRLKCVNYVI